MFWKKFRGIFMLGVGCITSPCCSPLIVPLALSLANGTPVAIWLSHRIGWIYGALTIISFASFILAVRWMQSHRGYTSRPANIPTHQHPLKVHDSDQ